MLLARPSARASNPRDASCGVNYNMPCRKIALIRSCLSMPCYRRGNRNRRLVPFEKNLSLFHWICADGIADLGTSQDTSIRCSCSFQSLSRYRDLSKNLPKVSGGEKSATSEGRRVNRHTCHIAHIHSCRRCNTHDTCNTDTKFFISTSSL